MLNSEIGFLRTIPSITYKPPSIKTNTDEIKDAIKAAKDNNVSLRLYFIGSVINL